MSGMSTGAFFDRKRRLDCGSLFLQTQLSSPREEVLQGVQKGDVMKLKLMSMAGPCLAMYNENIAGTIINKYIIQLIKCMNSGHEFIAEVREVEGGRCALTIKSPGKKN